MKRTFRALTVVPNSYSAGKRRYSVIYLLHGYGSDFRSWPSVVPLEQFADRYQMIFVAIDGGVNSWYLDSPVDRKSQFASYIVNEVIPAIDSNCRTQASASGRAIIGSSMGGHGALTLLARHALMFRGAGSISGIMDLAEFPDRWEIGRVLGQCQANRLMWQQNSFVGLLDSLRGKNRALVMDCGTEDFALPGNRRVHDLLLQSKIPHDYCERPGDHTSRFVARVAEYQILYFSRLLLPPR
jgi:S-formylglutathione hydrolase FrmB